ncbi:hypothetical protein [Streptomyces sp. NPDC008125]|uniref:hypothetical protein n=1 Tax=Streptomyces sp. NPDC008125 TaxID=3364811 RepID=UPI0036E589E5
MDLDDPTTDAKGRTGELRFGCTVAGCELTSRTAALELMPTETATTLDDCRTYLEDDKNHSIPLAAAANGSEICVRSAEGDIALLVIGVKSTAMPEAGFVQADMTIWRGAALKG